MPSRSRSLGCDHCAASRRSASTMSLGFAHAHGAGLAAVDLRQRIDEPRQRLIEGEVRHHGRDHRAQADRVVGARDRLHAVDGGRGKLEEQVVAGGGALLHLVDGRDQRGQILVLSAALAAHPWIGRLQDFEVPAIADPLRQSAVAVGVGIDQAGNDQASRRIEALARCRRAPSRALQGRRSYRLRPRCRALRRAATLPTGCGLRSRPLSCDIPPTAARQGSPRMLRLPAEQLLRSFDRDRCANALQSPRLVAERRQQSRQQ